MNRKPIPYLIIGAGITGLSAAHALGGDYLILEKEKTPGGYCRSIRQDGFVWDYAGHFFHFRTGEARQFFLSLFDPGELVVREKQSRIQYRGAYIDAPFQTHIHQLDKTELIDCLYDLFHRGQTEEGSSYFDMLYSRFGRSVTEKFLRPYNEKLYACDLSELDEKAMGRFFPYPNLPEIIESMKHEKHESYNSCFYYPRNGAGTFVEKLCGKLDPARILTGRELVSLDLGKKIATDSGGRQYRFDTLINTSPLHRFLPLLQEGSPDLRLSCNKVLVFNLGFERACPERREHWIYVPDREVNYYRFGFYSNLLEQGPASMYLEIGFPENAAFDDKEELRRALAALRRTGVLEEDNRLLSCSSLVMDPAYVHIGKDTEEAVGQQLEALAGKDVYSIGRYGAWTYCSMEDCMLEAWNLVKKLKRADGGIDA